MIKLISIWGHFRSVFEVCSVARRASLSIVLSGKLTGLRFSSCSHRYCQPLHKYLPQESPLFLKMPSGFRFPALYFKSNQFFRDSFIKLCSYWLPVSGQNTDLLPWNQDMSNSLFSLCIEHLPSELGRARAIWVLVFLAYHAWEKPPPCDCWLNKGKEPQTWPHSPEI